MFKRVLGIVLLLVGIFGLLKKFCLVDSRHVGFCLQIDPYDAEFAVYLIESDTCLGLNILWRKARLFQHQRKCHGKAAGMGCTDQLLRVGARFLLEP